MKILLFLSEAARGAFEHFENIIASIVPEGCLQTCHTISDLIRRLRDPWQNFDIVILTATSNQELGDLITFRGLLEELRIILIIPDRNDDTIHKGHLLAPRYLSFADGNFKDVAAVLEKMIVIVKKNKGLWEKGDIGTAKLPQSVNPAASLVEDDITGGGSNRNKVRTAKKGIHPACPPADEA